MTGGPGTAKPLVDLLVGPAAQVVTVAGPGGPGSLSASRRVSPTDSRTDPLAPPSYLGVIENGVVACAGERVVAVGPAGDVLARVEPARGCLRVGAEGKTVSPGLVDCHTHLVFGGWRAEEFEMRLRGASYMEILERGGGILSTVKATRAASGEELLAGGLSRLDAFLAVGTTTLEAKSGYGLDAEAELKCLRVARDLDRAHPVDVVSTFLGAHAIPPEYRGRTDEYVDLVAEDMIPRVAEEGLAEFVDVFCEKGVFEVEQCRRILEAGARYGLRAKLHADEFTSSGGAELAAEMGAVSADHLEKASPAGLRAMADRGVIAVVLPATAFFVPLPEQTSARVLGDLGVEVALATDFNPGSCTAVSLPLVMTIGCLEAGFTPAEVLWSTTLGAARAISRGDTIGSLAEGKLADLVIFDAPSYQHLSYRFGENLVETVIKRGRIVYRKPGTTAS